MASLAQHFTGITCPLLSSTPPSGARRPATAAPSTRSSGVVVVLVAGTYALTPEARERENLMQMFEEACERCRTAPMERASFTSKDLEATVEATDIDSNIGSLIKGRVFMTNSNSAFVDIQAKSTAFLPVSEACIQDIGHVEGVGIYPGLVEQFIIIDENPRDESLILSLRAIQQDLAWERCRNL